jgi:hypothetical protein
MVLAENARISARGSAAILCRNVRRAVPSGDDLGRGFDGPTSSLSPLPHVCREEPKEVLARDQAESHVEDGGRRPFAVVQP